MTHSDYILLLSATLGPDAWADLLAALPDEFHCIDKQVQGILLKPVYRAYLEGERDTYELARASGLVMSDGRQ